MFPRPLPRFLPFLTLLTLLVPASSGLTASVETPSHHGNVRTGTEPRKTTTLCLAESADGNIKARLLLTPSRVRLSDTATLILQIEYADKFQPILPEFGDSLGDFDIVGIDNRLVSHRDDRTVRELVLSLVPQRTGTIDIWPLSIEYRDRDTGKDAAPQVLRLPANRIEVLSPVDPKNVSLDDIAFPLQPLGRRRGLSGFLIATLVVGVGLLMAFLLYFLLRTRRRTRRQTLSPENLEDIARERLRELLDSRLHESDVHAFYIELTAIVRWYVEQVTGIHAPERTTEEFLYEISRLRPAHPFLTPIIRRDLQEFLEAADMVKFARFRPTSEETLKGFQVACNLVAHRTEQTDTELV